MLELLLVLVLVLVIVSVRIRVRLRVSVRQGRWLVTCLGLGSSLALGSGPGFDTRPGLARLTLAEG